MSRRPSGRILRRCAVLFGFGLLLAVVPIPAVSFNMTSVGAVDDVVGAVPMTDEDLAAAQAAADEPIGDDRVVAAEQDAGSFTAIGFTFDAAPDVPVMVRIRDASGELGEWQELEVNLDDGPDAGSPEAGRPGTEPLWVRDATGYEVSLGASDLDGARTVTVRDEMRRSAVDATPSAEATAPTPFGVNLRSAWGARAARSTSYGSAARMAVVHHSDSSNSYSPAEVPGVLRSIQAYHMDGQGWSDIAYNFVVDKYGGVWEGRAGGIAEPVIGAHAMGFNTNTVGVMVIGDYTTATPSAGALESVSQVIGWKLALGGYDPASEGTFTSGGSTSIPAGQVVRLPRVVGHQDVGATSCPGSIQVHLGSIRNRSQQWKDYIRPMVVGEPKGYLDQLSLDPQFGKNVLRAKGWAFDPDFDGQIDVDVVFNGSSRVRLLANNARPDVAAVYGQGAWSGFDRAIPMAPGSWQVCVEAVGVGAGGNLSLGCRQIVVK